MIPKLLDTRLASILGPIDYPLAMTAFDQDRTASFRINTLKTTAEEVESIIAREGFRVTKFEAIPGAYLLHLDDVF